MFQFGNRRKLKLLETYHNVKSSIFDFERISLFFSNSDQSDSYQVITSATLQDLDFEDLFMYLDRTCSKVGQQYLYATLRTIPKNQYRVKQFESIIEFLNNHPAIKESLILELSKLNKPGAYFIQSLLYGENVKRPSWFWIIPLLSMISLTTVFLSFIYPIFLILLIPILGINFIFHFWNKKNILSYSNSIPQLLNLNRVALNIIKSGLSFNNEDLVKKSVLSINKSTKSAIFFKMEADLSSDAGQLAEFILELIKVLFLLEPIFTFKILSELDSKKAQLNEVFKIVGIVDTAISISSFRESLPYYSFPEINDKSNSFYACELYHPLINNPVSNSIDLLDGKSVLITGSNMSGKSTFIRTIGINAILAQTINIAFAKKFVISKLKVHSAVRISDSLLDETSYYYKEVKTVKDMIGECDSGNPNLFLLDELFKGTNTVERIAAGKATLTYLNRGNNLVFVSTHDIELVELLNSTFNYFHFSETIEDEKLRFDYKLKGGKLSNTNAIRILELNKFPQDITEEAKALAIKIRGTKTI